ncbi:MAG: nitrile hydratase accessory protein, partial [Pseudomonadota bacterium]
MRDDGEPAFEEPWQAHILAVAFALAERGLFAPSEWSDALGAELRRRAGRGEPDSRYTYYAAALSALETLVTRTGLIAGAGLDERTEQWRRAYLNTPHG